MISKRVQAFTESVIREMTRISEEHNGVNLAQGMPDLPDFPPPRALILVEAPACSVPAASMRTR